MAQADPAHQIGLQPTLYAVLIAVESGGGGVGDSGDKWETGRRQVGGNFRHRKLD
jgi:hypothetical protein